MAVRIPVVTICREIRPSMLDLRKVAVVAANGAQIRTNAPSGPAASGAGAVKNGAYPTKSTIGQCSQIWANMPRIRRLRRTDSRTDHASNAGAWLATNQPSQIDPSAANVNSNPPVVGVEMPRLDNAALRVDPGATGRAAPDLTGCIVATATVTTSANAVRSSASPIMQSNKMRKARNSRKTAPKATSDPPTAITSPTSVGLGNTSELLPLFQPGRIKPEDLARKPGVRYCRARHPPSFSTGHIPAEPSGRRPAPVL